LGTVFEEGFGDTVPRLAVAKTKIDVRARQIINVEL
jgi:hypothetical protein